MTYGYSLRLIDRNKAADPDHLGVRLGRQCINKGVPVSDVAERFGVSRQTVYNWFSGAVSPADSLAADIKAFISSL